MANDTQPPLLDTRGAARLLGIAERTACNWRVNGEGPGFIRVGRSVRYDPRTLAAWLDERRFRSTSEADAAPRAA